MSPLRLKQANVRSNINDQDSQSSPSEKGQKDAMHSDVQVSIAVDTRELPLSIPAHTLTAEAIIAELEGDAQRGLTHERVKSLLERWGPNRLKPPVRPSLWKIFLRQIANAMTIVLMYVLLSTST